jgi:methyltransferase
MVAVHTGLFLGSAAEVWWLERAFIPLLGWVMLLLLAACVAGRVWVWRSLGEQWNTQVVASTRPIVDTGPYRYVRHPNYTIVIVEMFALPLTHTAYLTALVCSVLNAFVLRTRIQLEEAVLFSQSDYVVKMAGKPRFLPARGGGR